MILGRDPSLWLGAATALVNAAVLLHVVSITGDQLAAVDTVLGAIIALVAGTITNHAAIVANGK